MAARGHYRQRRKRQDQFFKKVQREERSKEKRLDSKRSKRIKVFERERVYGSTRKAMAKEQGMLCHYCEQIMKFVDYYHYAKTDTDLPPDAVTTEHLIPVSKGGTNKRDNLVAACWQCNSERNDLDVDHDYFMALKRQQIQAERQYGAVLEAKNVS